MKPMLNGEKPTISVFVVRKDDNTFFGGFDREQGTPVFVESPLKAKFFHSKHNVPLRSDEALVELTITMDDSNTAISSPFRLKRKPKVQQEQTQ